MCVLSAAYSVPVNLPDQWLLCLEVICGAMGVSQPLDDDRLDAFAAAVSPGPALTLAFCEALTMGAASLGLPWHIARKMAAQTVRTGMDRQLCARGWSGGLWDDVYDVHLLLKNCWRCWNIVGSLVIGPAFP